MTIPIAPMKARALKEGLTMEDFNSNEWTLEEKYDGHRLVTLVNGGTVIAWSSLGNIRELPMHVLKQMRGAIDGVYDGELLVPHGTSTDVTALDQQDQLNLVLFDMMRLGDDSIMQYSAEHRRHALETATRDIVGNIIRLSAQHRPSRDTLEKIWSAGGEGAILKRVNSTYQPGNRSKDWVKFKKLQPAVVTIVGFEEGLLGPHSKIICADAAGVIFTVKTLNDEWRAMFATAASTFIGRKLVIEYQDRTTKNKYRHPRADHLL